MFQGKRVNIFKQARGDINQLKPVANNVVFNALRRDSTKKWDYLKDTNGNNVVPYVIQGQYGSCCFFIQPAQVSTASSLFSFTETDEINIIMGAMKRIEENVCIRFRPRTTEADYIEFQNEFFEGYLFLAFTGVTLHK